MTQRPSYRSARQPAKLFARLTSWHQIQFSSPVLLRRTLSTTQSDPQREIESGTQIRRPWPAVIKSFLIIFVLGIILIGGAGKVLAEDVFKDICTSSASSSTACQDKNAVDPSSPDKNPLFGSNGVLTTIVSILGILVGIAAVISIIVAGIKYMTSGNNPQEVNNSRELVLYALIALFVVAFSQVLVRFFLNRVF